MAHIDGALVARRSGIQGRATPWLLLVHVYGSLNVGPASCTRHGDVNKTRAQSDVHAALSAHGMLVLSNCVVVSDSTKAGHLRLDTSRQHPTHVRKTQHHTRFYESWGMFYPANFKNRDSNPRVP